MLASINHPVLRQVLECGTVFTANKSLFLDGINYVKIADGRGWVFSKKGDTQVLDLLEVCRKRPAAAAADDEDNHGPVPDASPVKAQSRSPYWTVEGSLSPPPPISL